VKATFSIFPKFYKHLDVRGLAALVRDVGLDTTNAVIRDGYWVTPGGLAEEMPAFVRAMDAEGVKVTFCTAGYSAAQVIADDTPLKVLADCGITAFRMGYFRPGRDVDIPAAMDAARAEMEQVAAVCERVGIRAVYQVHHGTLVPTATGAYYLVRGLPPAHVGVMLDPGNQAFEGFEKWQRSARMLGAHFCAVGVKDVAWSREPAGPDDEAKGWRRTWATLDEGVTNWHDVVRAAKSVDFDGTFVWMPFYDEGDPDEMTRKLQREVAYLRKVVAEVEAEA